MLGHREPVALPGVEGLLLGIPKPSNAIILLEHPPD